MHLLKAALASQGRRRAHVTWTPAELTNLRGWYRADSLITLVGGDVDVWGDLSGNGNDLTAPGSSKRGYYFANGFGPNSQPYVQGGNGTKELIKTVFSWGGTVSAFTYIAVFKSITVGVGNVILGYYPGPVYIWQEAGPDVPRLTGIDFVNCFGTTVTTTESMITTAWDGANQYLYNKGTQEDTDANAGAAVADGQQFGVFSLPSVGAFSDCEIAEVIVMRAAITAPELASAVAYINTRYGI
jgi:hypothetical protein